ncbi:DUF58 domain-containing protein [Shewanella gelidii]|uniref:DUF58 domain-containing protein n=1 Tax=Shewanella gelidii TaxID=1642821 RepID=A0A917JX59_9GAMM|nr:DUF58 domain-containing protein [Shewanella gelidii]MCL1098163.1 DUF58 domain-containing protein [Shewanella gelidii]GGI91079.1 DUF58 domain-containing protein [Shewanella gelidii]
MVKANNTKKRKRLWLNTQFRARWLKWMDKRLPANRHIQLSHRSIFILPSKFGVVWFGLVILLYLFGTNYQNNLVIGLSILLASILHTCIIYSYRNLAGLKLQSMPAAQVYAGDTLSFPSHLSSEKGANEVLLSYPFAQGEVDQSIAPQVKQAPVKVLVSYPSTPRGRVNPGRLKIESYYPLGLCRAWSYVDLATELIVYPTPVESKIALNAQQSNNQQENHHGRQVAGIDEYQGLKEYVKGESLKQVAWKQLAQGKGMLTKEFQQPLGAPIWLTLDSSQSRNYETKISELTWQVEKLHQSNQLFGLKIDNITIEPSHGEGHRHACLEALSLLPKFDGGTPS